MNIEISGETNGVDWCETWWGRWIVLPLFAVVGVTGVVALFLLAVALALALLGAVAAIVGGGFAAGIMAVQWMLA